jgi:hypothetical protein
MVWATGQLQEHDLDHDLEHRRALHPEEGVDGLPVVGPSEIRRSVQDMVLGEVKRTFNPEFINRIDEMIVFEALTDDDLRTDSRPPGRAAQRQPARPEDPDGAVAGGDRLDDRGDVQGPLVRSAPLRRAIQRYVEDPLSEELIRGTVAGGRDRGLPRGRATGLPSGRGTGRRRPPAGRERLLPCKL